jgi:hypothetical protein
MWGGWVYRYKIIEIIKILKIKTASLGLTVGRVVAVLATNGDGFDFNFHVFRADGPLQRRNGPGTGALCSVKKAS